MRQRFTRVLGIAILVIAISACFFISVGSEAEIITIDVDGGGDYSTIQQGIDNATEGDTIHVRPGAYNGTVFLNRSLILQGESLPTIFGLGGNGFNVTADNVTIQGFNITNCSVAIQQNASGIVLRDNVFWMNERGFHWERIETDLEEDIWINPTIIEGNTFQLDGDGLYAIYIDLEFEFNQTKNEVVIGELTISSNELYVERPETEAIILWYPLISWLGGGTITIGDVNVFDNTVEGSDFAIDFFGEFSYLFDVNAAIGDISITGNDLEDQRSGGIFVDYCEAHHWYGSSTGTFGDLIISDNRITSSRTPDAIEVYDYAKFQNFFDDATLIFGDVSIENNEVDGANRGIVLSYAILANQLFNNATLEMGNANVRNNTLVNVSQGIDFELGWMEYCYDRSSVSVGAVQIIDNSIHSGTMGIFFHAQYLGYSFYENASGTVGDILIHSNVVSTESGDCLRTEWNNIGHHLYGQSMCSFGNFLVKENDLTSHDGLGIRFTNLYDVGSYLYDTSQFSIDTIQFSDNLINSTDDGIYVGDMYSLGSYLYNETRVIFGNIEFTHNDITTQSNGIDVVEMKYLGAYLYGEAQAIFGSIRFNENYVTSRNGKGIEFGNIENFAFSMHQDSTMTLGDIEFDMNTLDCSDDGMHFQKFRNFGESLYDNSSFRMGSFRFNDNTISSGGKGLHIESFLQLGTGLDDSSRCTIDEFDILRNQVNSIGPGIHLGSVKWFGENVRDFSKFMFGNFSVNENNLTTEETGIHIQDLASFGSGTDDEGQMIMENLEVSRNLIDAGRSGIYIQSLTEIGNNVEDNGSFLMGMFAFDENVITCDHEGIAVGYFGEVGYDLEDDAQVVIGDVSFSENTITSDRSGLFIEAMEGFGARMSERSTFTMGEFTFTGNTLISERSGIEVEDLMEIGHRMSDTAEATIGGFHFDENDIQARDGIYIEHLGVGSLPSNDASVVVGAISVGSNTIVCTGSGIGIDDGLKLGSDMSDNASCTVGSITISHNLIEGLPAAGDGIYLDFTNFDTNRFNDSIFLMESLFITGNHVEGFTGTPSGVHLIEVDDAIISANSIKHCGYGIYLWDTNDTIIRSNVLFENSVGMSVNGTSAGNTIYHNIFSDNNQSAFDEGVNIWDDGYPSGGNNWSDFDEPAEGAFDVNLDNIADSPYNISGGGNTDRFPRVDIPDRDPPEADAGPDQTVTEKSIVTLDGSKSTDNGQIVNWTWEFVDGGDVSLYGVAPSYEFRNIGKFTVTLTVADTMGNVDSDTVQIVVKESDDDEDSNTMAICGILLLLLLILIILYLLNEQKEKKKQEGTEDELGVEQVEERGEGVGDGKGEGVCDGKGEDDERKGEGVGDGKGEEDERKGEGEGDGKGEDDERK